MTKALDDRTRNCRPRAGGAERREMSSCDSLCGTVLAGLVDMIGRPFRRGCARLESHITGINENGDSSQRFRGKGCLLRANRFLHECSLLR